MFVNLTKQTIRQEPEIRFWFDAPNDKFGIWCDDCLSLAADAAMWRSTSSSIPKPHKSSCSGSRIRKAKAIAFQGDVSDTQKRGGVLGTTSVHEESAWSGCSAYTASKAAVSPE